MLTNHPQWLLSVMLLGILAHPATAQTGGQTDASLVGSWQVEDVDRQGVLDRARLSLSFSKEGRLSGSSGCNALAGSFSLDRSSLRIGPVAGTRKMCASEALMNQEQRLLRSLQGINTLTWNSDGAAVLSGPQGRSITLRRD